MKNLDIFLKNEGFVLTNKNGGEKAYPATFLLTLMKKYDEYINSETSIPDISVKYSINDIVSKEYIYDLRYNIKATGYWLVKDKNINLDSLNTPIFSIIHSDDSYFTIEGNRSIYSTFEYAYKEIIKKFKRKNLIA